ncbi:MAG: pilus assembly protein [Bdellovibrionales bacterium]|nr:pilus assembly protein [Bdellovibrionales bacterium]
MALVEFSLVLPVFLLLFALLVDVGMLLQQYYTLSQLAYQGSRLMSDTPDLELATYAGEAPQGTVHYEVQNKINRMINQYGNKLRAGVSVTTRRWQEDVLVGGDPQLRSVLSPEPCKEVAEIKDDNSLTPDNIFDAGDKGSPCEAGGGGTSPEPTPTPSEPPHNTRTDMVEVRLEMSAPIFFRAIWGNTAKISASSTGPFLFVGE